MEDMLNHLMQPQETGLQFFGTMGVLSGARFGLGFRVSQKLTWKPKKGPVKTTVLQKGDWGSVMFSGLGLSD